MYGTKIYHFYNLIHVFFPSSNRNADPDVFLNKIL
jgi:hypothetical protein